MPDIRRETFLLLLLSLSIQTNHAVSKAELDSASCSGEETVTSGTVVKTNYTQLLACGNWSRTVSITDGYYMDLTVDSLNIGPGDYLTVSSGSRMVVSPSTAVFVGKIHMARRIRAMRSNTVHLQFFTSSTKAFNLEGFAITFSADRPLTTTAKPTDPPSTLPTAPANLSDSYTIYLSGRKAVDFLQYKAGLQSAIKEMAERYCADNNITILQNITEQNVVFKYVERCDVTWPNSVQCVKVWVSVPVVVSSGYQLTARRIRDMWESYAPLSSRLSQIGLQVYTTPNAQGSMDVWLGIIFSVLGAFSILLVIIWRRSNSKSLSKRDPSITESQTRVSTASNQSWLGDLPHQDLPVNVWDNIREFEPDNMLTRVPMASTPTGGRPHVPVPDSKHLPDFSGAMFFGPDKQALISGDEDRGTNNVSVS